MHNGAALSFCCLLLYDIWQVVAKAPVTWDEFTSENELSGLASSWSLDEDLLMSESMSRVSRIGKSRSGERFSSWRICSNVDDCNKRGR